MQAGGAAIIAAAGWNARQLICWFETSSLTEAGAGAPAESVMTV